MQYNWSAFAALLTVAVSLAGCGSYDQDNDAAHPPDSLSMKGEVEPTDTLAPPADAQSVPDGEPETDAPDEESEDSALDSTEHLRDVAEETDSVDAELPEPDQISLDDALIGDTTIGDGEASDSEQPRDCLNDKDCDDNNPCTVDDCAEGQCEYEFIWCEDGDLCTLDGCSPPVGCVFINVLCPEVGNPCNPLACEPTTGQCVQTPQACDDGNPCTLDGCDPAQGCTHEPLTGGACCANFSDCGRDSECVSWKCEDSQCILLPIAECCAPEVYAEGFDNGIAPGFDFEGPKGGPVSWGILPPKTVAPSFALYFGDPTALNYAGGPWKARAFSPPIAVPGEAAAWLELEWIVDVEPAAGFDEVRVLAVVGTEELLLWTKHSPGATLGEWHTLMLALHALAGSTVRVAIEFDTVDDAFNDAFGVAIDAMRVVSNCSPLPCANQDVCKQPIPAFIGQCAGGQCSYGPNPSTCAAADDCPVAGACEVASCLQGYCTIAEVAGCCTSPENCDDGDSCTLDLCVGPPGQDTGNCAYSSSPLCCSTLADCKKTDPCAVGSCPGELEACIFAPTQGCCVDHFDCPAIGECGLNFCMDNQCSAMPACCAAESDCKPMAGCPASCDGGACVYHWDSPLCCEGALWNEGFEELGLGPAGQGELPTSGWLLGGDVGAEWHFAGPAFEGQFALAFGNPAAGTYDLAGPGPYAAVSPLFSLPHAKSLTFRLWLENEWSGAASSNLGVDRLSVWLDRDGEPSSLLWSSASADLPWWDTNAAQHVLGAAYVRVGPLPLPEGTGGDQARVRFEFQTYDGLWNNFAGPRVDAVTVARRCQSEPN